MSNRIYNWAILGCGKIAGKFSRDLQLLPNARRYAAASRDAGKAHEFAARHGFEKSYGSYDELVHDANVDIVYVATPHSHHFDHVLLCLNHGKAVLVEKAFALNAAQALQMINTARSRQIFLMEAFWTRFQPSFLKVLEVVASGELGRARMMRSEFCFHAPFDPSSRLYNPMLGGGSLLDIGIYPVFWSLQLFGVPATISTTVVKAATGTDLTLAVTLQYAGGEIAQLASSLDVTCDTQTEVWCEKGFIRSRRVDANTVCVTIQRKDQASEEILFNLGEGFGLFLEARHVMECLDAGLTESPVLSLGYSLQQMELLDKIRHQADIRYPVDR